MNKIAQNIRKELNIELRTIESKFNCMKDVDKGKTWNHIMEMNDGELINLFIKNKLQIQKLFNTYIGTNINKTTIQHMLVELKK